MSEQAGTYHPRLDPEQGMAKPGKNNVTYGKIPVVRSFGWAYKRGGLYPRELESERTFIRGGLI